MGKGKIAQPGEGVNFGKGQWLKGKPAKVEHVLPADPLIFIQQMPQDWIDAGIMDKWEDGSTSFVGPLSELNRKLAAAGLGPLEPLDDDKPMESQYKSGLDHRNAKPITFEGRTLTRKEWADELGIHSTSLLERLKKYPLSEALTKPKRKQIPYHTKTLTHEGVTKTWAEWAEHLGLAVSSFRSRILRHPNNMEKIMAPAQLAKGWNRA